MLWPITRAITLTCCSKTEQIVIIPLNKNNGSFKIRGFFEHPVLYVKQEQSCIEATYKVRGEEKRKEGVKFQETTVHCRRSNV